MAIFTSTHQRSVGCAALALAACLALAAPASATSDDDRGDARTLSASAGLAPFWRDEAAPTRAAPRPRALGRAPYLCTPSGFGRIARCYLRGQLTSN